MESFRNIGIIGRLGSTQVLETIRRLKRFLTERHLHVILEDTIAEVLPGHGLQTCSRKIMGEICDLVVVVGGDGSMLGAARALARHKVPVLGINRGSLGFLTDIRPDELETKVDEVLGGQYIVESRFLLDAQVRRHGESIGQGDALNDVVLHPGKSTRMIEFELHIDGQFVCSQKADGLIVATPTGSTAYAFSARGPIVEPTLRALLLTPVSPHMLFDRTLVLDDDAEVRLTVGGHRPAALVVDGRAMGELQPGDVVSCRAASHAARLVMFGPRDFHAILKAKFGLADR